MIAYTQIGSASPTYHPSTAIAPNYRGTVYSTYSTILTGLNGGTITCLAFAYGSVVAADPLNAGQINVTALFLR